MGNRPHVVHASMLLQFVVLRVLVLALTEVEHKTKESRRSKNNILLFIDEIIVTTAIPSMSAASCNLNNLVFLFLLFFFPLLVYN